MDNMGTGLNAQIIHQVIVITAQFVIVMFLAKIIFDLVFIPLESSNDVRDFQFIDPERYVEGSCAGLNIGVKLGDLGVVGFHQLADLGKRKIDFIQFQYHDRTGISAAHQLSHVLQ
jgi:hypothetical protein